jgi:hypothetical protein
VLGKGIAQKSEIYYYPDFDSKNSQKSLQLIEKQAFILPFQNTNMFI